jgi:hypothetical protein
MPRAFVRLFAVVLLLGQLVQVSGGLVCASLREHHVQHCDDGMSSPAGASVTAPMGDLATAFCDLVGPCGTPVPGVTASMPGDYSSPETVVIARARAAAPASFHSAPIPPPPQA